MDRIITMPSQYLVACHTNYIGVGSTFVAIKGMKDDGINHIKTALEKGATTIVVEDSVQISDAIKQLIVEKNATLEIVHNARAALAQLSACALGYPANKLRVIGVTGTKGKTTSAFLLEHIFKTAGYKTALLSTVYNKILDTTAPTNLTTQHPDYLHNFFTLCVQQSVEIVVMEVAAQATSLHRIDGIEFDGLLFTNFAQEHGEFYATMEDYFAAKVAMITQLKPGAPLLINGDDRRVAALSKTCANALLFGIHNASSMYRAEILDNGLHSLKVKIYFNKFNRSPKFADFPHPSTKLREDGKSNHSSYCVRPECFCVSKNVSKDVEGSSGVQEKSNECTLSCSSLLGEYNAYNIVGVTSLCLELCVAWEVVAQAIQSFERVPGRLERYHLPNGASCFIDYAHNPSSYQAVLSMVRTMTSHLIVVFGCGGDRDASKRPIMGQVAAVYADLVILTADNPRSEKAEDIMQDILAGIDGAQRNKVLCEVDRERAIKLAYMHSKSGSVIMLLGKGPDEYQLIGTQKFPFSEKAIVASL